MEYIEGLVSIIIPVYKVEQFLDDCIISLVNQTYTNFEAILVDDGSPDSCPGKCDKWEREDKRIRVIHQKNSGCSRARNNGLNLARGEFIAFLDSDDMYAPTFLEDGVKAIRSNHTEIFYCQYSDISENDRYGDLQPTASDDDKIDVIEANAFWEKYKKAKLNELISIIVVWSKMYRREVFEGVRFKEGILHEDEIILHHIIGKCNQIACSSKANYYYRNTQGSVMQSQFSIRNLDFAEGVIERLEYFKKTGNISALTFDWGRGSRCLLKGYNELNRKDVAVNERLRELRAKYTQWASYIGENTKSKQVKFQMTLFTKGFNAYRILQKINAKM